MNETPNRWRGRRVLVTGCTGLLGSAVTRELLAGGGDVVGLIREHRAIPDFTTQRFPGQLRVVRGRVEDRFRIYSALAIHEAVALFHLAPADERGTTTVLEAASSYNRQLPVVIARPATTNSVPVTSARLGIARFGELFGPSDRNEEHVIPVTLKARLTGSQLPFTLNGPAKDFVYANDAARACVTLANALAEPTAPHIMAATFRSGWECTDREMSASVRDTFDGLDAPHNFDAVPTNPLGWSPSYSIGDALNETAAWWREHHDTRAATFNPRLRSAA